MKIYFARHGQTASNKLRVLQGSGIDENLNEEGIGQAECLARQLAGFKFDVVFVSSLKRARQTADIALAGLDHKPQVMDEWCEWSLGSWEGKSVETHLPQFLGDGEPEGGETRKEFYSRVEFALNLALKEAAATRTVLIIAHGGVWMAVQDLLKIPRFKITNCALVELSQINGQWHQRLLEAESVIP